MMMNPDEIIRGKIKAIIKNENFINNLKGVLFEIIGNEVNNNNNNKCYLFEILKFFINIYNK